MTITLEEIVGLVAQYSTLGRRGVADTNTTATALIDAEIGGYARAVNEGDIFYCYYNADAQGSAPEEAQSWATKFDPSTGTVTLSPTTTTAITVSDKYEHWDKAVEDRARVTEAVNRALTQKCHYRTLTPLSFIPDGDCQSPTSWAANIGASDDHVIALGVRSNPLYGRYYLSLTASDDGGDADYSYQEFPVTAGEKWYYCVEMWAEEDTEASIVLYDLANAGAITVDSSGDTLAVTGLASASDSDYELLFGSYEVPTGCDRISLRLFNDTHSKESRFGFIAMWPEKARFLPVPSRVVSDSRLGTVYRLYETETTDYPYTARLSPYRAVDIIPGWQVGFRGTLGSRGPFFIEEDKNWAALSDDDSTVLNVGTTDCEGAYVGWLGAVELATEVASRRTFQDGPEAALPFVALEERVKRSANTAVANFVPKLSVAMRT